MTSHAYRLRFFDVVNGDFRMGAGCHVISNQIEVNDGHVLIDGYGPLQLLSIQVKYNKLSILVGSIQLIRRCLLPESKQSTGCVATQSALWLVRLHLHKLNRFCLSLS